MHTSASQVPIVWEEVDVTPRRDATGRIVLPAELFESMARSRVGLKGTVRARHPRRTFTAKACQPLFNAVGWRARIGWLARRGRSGPLETPIGKGHISLNLTLRRCVCGSGRPAAPAGEREGGCHTLTLQTTQDRACGRRRVPGGGGQSRLFAPQCVQPLRQRASVPEH